MPAATIARATRPPGTFVPIKDRGGLPPIRGQASAAPKPSGTQSTDTQSMMSVIRPSARDRWMQGILSYYTPAIVETTVRSALAGNLFAQWLMFDLMEQTWPRLSSNLNQLKDAVIALDRVVEPFKLKGQDASPEAVRRATVIEAALLSMKPRQAYSENGYDRTIYDVLDAVGKGISVLDVDFQSVDMPGLAAIDFEDGGPALNGNIVAPRCTRWVHPRYYGYPPANSYDERLMLNTREVAFNNPDFIASYGKDAPLYVDFPDDKFIISIMKQKSGHPLNASRLRILGFFWAAQNFTWEAFFKTSQIFGNPFLWVNYESGTDTQAVMDMLYNLGTFNKAAFPTGVEIKFEEAMQQGRDNLQKQFIEAGDTICDILILGQSGTNEIGGGAGGGNKTGSFAAHKVMGGLRGEKISAVARAGDEVLNTSIIPALCRKNFGDDSECPTHKMAERDELDPLALAQRDVALHAFLPLSKAQMYQAHKLNPPMTADDTIPVAAVAAPFGGKPGEEGKPGEGNAGDEAGEGEIGDEAMAAGLDPAVGRVSGALRDTVEPMLKRLERINAIEDSATKVDALRKFLKDHGNVAAAMLHDPSLADAVTVEAVSKLVKGMNEKPRKGRA